MLFHEKSHPDAYAVILAGGEGTRFASAGTSSPPKQFLNVDHPHRSLLQQTWDRILPLVDVSRIFISTNERYLSLVREQLPQVSLKNILAEPLKKNTAPAMTYVCSLLALENPNALVLFLPSDHSMSDGPRARDVFHQAFSFAALHDRLVAFGVPPSEPSPHYGYIFISPKKGEGPPWKAVSFVEKPTVEKARDYLKTQNYLWNSGIFLCRASFFLEELKLHQPQMYRLVEDFLLPSGARFSNTQGFFENVENVSIDYALIEKTKNISIFPLDVGWRDMGVKVFHCPSKSKII